jgi:hypothetical protein
MTALNIFKRKDIDCICGKEVSGLLTGFFEGNLLIIKDEFLWISFLCFLLWMCFLECLGSFLRSLCCGTKCSAAI